MSDKVLKATLIADDKMSATFKKAGDSAKTLGDALEQSGDAGKAAAKELDEAGKSAEELDQRLAAAYKGGQQLGIGLLGLAAASAAAGKSYRDQQIEIETLERSYGTASDEIESFITKLEDSSNFSDEAARAAANQAATLARNYGFTGDEIERVLQISADLAALNPNIGLEDATYRVTAALRGEGEAAEALGLTMNQQAIDRNNLTLTMSNEEAAHYRLNALIEQSAFAQGAAAEQSKDAYGSAIDLAQGIQDVGQRYGEALGPIGEFGALIADHPAQAIAAAAALKSLQIGAQGVLTAYNALKGVKLTEVLSGGAGAVPGLTGLIGLLSGPAGIVVAAGLAGVAVKEFTGGLGPSFHQASDDAIASVDALIAKVVELGDTSALANTVLGLDTITASQQKLNDEANRGIGTIGELIAEAASMDDANASTAEGLLISSAAFDEFTQAQRDAIDANGDGVATLQELQAAQTNFTEAAKTSKEVLDGLNNGADELSQIFAMTGEGAAFAKSEANAYTDALLNGQMSAADYENALQQLIVGYGDVQEAALLSGEATSQHANATTQSTDALVKWLDAGGDVHTLSDDIAKSMIALGNASVDAGSKVATALTPLQLRTANGLDDLGKQLAEYGRLSTQMSLPGDDGSFDQQINQTKQSVIEYTAAQAGLQHGIEAAAAAMSYQVGESKRLADELTADQKKIDAASAALGKAFEDARTQITATATNLDTVFGAIVGNTNAIAQNAQSVQDWADKLIGAEGTYAQIDDLLQAGAITLDDYTAAQESYNVIAGANTRIQQDVLSIQAQLAPYVAASTEALAAQLDVVAGGSTDLQLFTLGMMDAATSSQALQLANSYLQDQDTFGPIVESAAKLNPMLAQILEEMGLISYNPITNEVKLLGVDDAQSELEMLNDTMTRLNQTVATLVAVLQDDASGPINDVLGLAAALGITVATPTAVLNDLASGPLYAIQSLMGGLNGMTATTYVQTVYESVTSDTRFGAQRHGGIPGYATGGVIAELAESGPERLHFANGGTAMVYDRGVYAVPANTYVSPNNAVGSRADPVVNVSFDGAVFNNTSRAEMRAWATEEFIPALRDVIRDTRRGQVS